MQPGEILVARLKAGATLVRSLPATGRGDRVRISVGRNREAQLPAGRVIMATGIIASDYDQVEELRHRCESLSSEIDLRDLWELVRDEPGPMSLEDLADLYWGAPHEMAQRLALLLHLDRTSLYFAGGAEGYAARSKEEVEEIEARDRRQAENAEAARSLMEHLSDGKLPSEPTPHQSSLLGHLRGFAVHGDDYTRSALARSLLESADGGTRDPQRLSFELLVGAGVLSPDEPLELERAGIVEEFSPEVLAAAAAIDLTPFLADASRRDLTGLRAVTIDDAGTEDRDDALSLEVETSGSSVRPVDREGATAVYRIGVHIADAGSLIPRGGAIDQEADRRMATLYLPERKVGMLPPEIASRAGSLVAGESRVAVSLLARITESGDVEDWEVVPSVIRSRAALAYGEADRAIDDSAHEWHDMLAPLGRVSGSLRSKRQKAGALLLERPEMIIELSAAGEVEVRLVARSGPARQMVAELMILFNSLMAEFCRREELPAAYRSQAVPDVEDIDREVPEGPLRQYLMSRRLTPAELGTTPSAHGGLGVAVYIQATSPLRRYPDLAMQRQVSRFLDSGEPQYSREEIASVAQRAEVQLRELSRLEEDRRRYWFLKFLGQRLESDGDSLWDAMVLDNQPRRTALLELAAYPFRVRAELPPSSVPGEAVTLRLHGVDLWRRTAQFVHAPDAGESSLR